VWSTRLGVKENTPPSIDIVDLYSSVVKGAWPRNICDLDIDPDALTTGAFPTQSPSRVLSVSSVDGAYLLSSNDGRHRGWKLLIPDPLTVLQIEREAWDSSTDGLIVDLIRKGLPFKILNVNTLQETTPYGHPGPVTHEAGKAPGHVDYVAYREQLGGFFSDYPHAYAAALSAGGILWRIAMDALPLPHESDITRQFHPGGCASSVVGGVKYWTPMLTVREEEIIVGVYRWAVCKSSHDDPWIRDAYACLQLPRRVPETTAGGRSVRSGRHRGLTLAHGLLWMSTGMLIGAIHSRSRLQRAFGPSAGRRR
jgi:hypothetical protein